MPQQAIMMQMINGQRVSRCLSLFSDLFRSAGLQLSGGVETRGPIRLLEATIA